ncbi:uncharacterized protein [Panulirus ornatus]|uniref:uncharacterized protein n=1 Tax=Panulirus ornatus TaxID=150431 RepID=UPI003A862112
MVAAVVEVATVLSSLTAVVAEAMVAALAPAAVEAMVEATEWTSVQATATTTSHYVTTEARKTPGRMVTTTAPALATAGKESASSEGRPQPDNSEKGGEHCLAVLNNFYKDGIKWHDVACYHEKPIVCERRRRSHYG